MRVSHRVALASALLLARAVSAPLATCALDGVAFYAPSLVTAADAYGPFVVEMPSLNAGLWAAANQTTAEKPFSIPPHAPGVLRVRIQTRHLCKLV